MSNQEEIIEVCGKKVEVRYESDYYEACDKCCFHNIFVRCNVRTLCHGCPCEKYSDDKNHRFAYFIPAEKDDTEFCKDNCKGYQETGRCFTDGDCKAKQEADLKASIGIGTDTWFQQLKIGDKVETYDGRIETIRKKYDDSFMLGFDAEGRKNCTPDGYFPIAISECRPFVDQPSSIAPEVDLEKEIKRFLSNATKMNKGEWRGKYPISDIGFRAVARHFAEWERKRTLDKVVEWMKKNLTYIHPRKGVETCMVNIPAFLDAMNEENT